MSDLHVVDLLWQKVIERVPDIRTKLSLKHGSFICADEAELFLLFTSAFHHAAVSTVEGKSMVEQAIVEVFGRPYVLRYLLVSQDDWQRLQGHFYASGTLLMPAISRS